jgi:hypothetical protein
MSTATVAVPSAQGGLAAVTSAAGRTAGALATGVIDRAGAGCSGSGEPGVAESIQRTIVPSL